MLCRLYAPAACQAIGSIGEYLDLGLFSFSFSMFGRLFSVQSASPHPAVSPDRVKEAANIFRDLGFLYCPECILSISIPAAGRHALPDVGSPLLLQCYLITAGRRLTKRCSEQACSLSLSLDWLGVPSGFP
jgi:hypothetical protein